MIQRANYNEGILRLQRLRPLFFFGANLVQDRRGWLAFHRPRVAQEPMGYDITYQRTKCRRELHDSSMSEARLLPCASRNYCAAQRV